MALTRYKITINKNIESENELGIDMIAFTSDPAIMIKGVAFNKHQKMNFSDSEKMRIAGPVLIPMAIYRMDDDGEYEVEFTEEVIGELHSKLMSNLNNVKSIFNLEHTTSVIPANLLEIWIVEDPKNDKSFHQYGIEVPKGTLFAVSQIQDKSYFKALKDNDQIGYSIEGFLGLELKKIKKNNETMKDKVKLSIDLPVGVHNIGDKVYIVESKLGVISYKVFASEDVPVEEEKLADLPVDEKKPVEKKPVEDVPVEDEKLAEEVVVEDAPAEEAPVVESVTHEMVQEMIDEKLQPLIDMIADMKVNSEDVKEVVETTPVKMSIHQKFALLNK